jgi:acetyl esterase
VRRWLRPVCTALSVFAGVIGLTAAIGSLWPQLPFIGIVAAVLTGFFALHLVLVAAMGVITALLARRFGAGNTAVVMIIVNALAAAVLLVPLTSQVSAARRAGAALSWGAHLRVVAPGPRAIPTRTAEYATVDGKKLYLDIYQPTTQASAAPSTPVVMIHGGGFVHGNRSDGRDWDRWFAERGYTVFDVDYRLNPPVNWNLAAADVVCALSWIRQHEQELNIVASHALIVGQSAGASLALQVAYGVGDDSVGSSCGGAVDVPVAVFAIYPAEDFTLAWEQNLKLGPVSGRDINIGYIGGSPAQFPERYHVVSAIEHVRPGLPPTMVVYGAHDHLVPIRGHAALHSNLEQSGIPSVLLEIPYSDHGYDLVWGSLGAQITRHVLVNFLSAHCPSTPPHRVEEPGQ